MKYCIENLPCKYLYWLTCQYYQLLDCRSDKLYIFTFLMCRKLNVIYGSAYYNNAGVGIGNK